MCGRSSLAVQIILVVLFAGPLSGASAEPILMFHEPRDALTAKSSCEWAENEIKVSQYLIKALKCAESELCQRALDINSACKVIGPVREVQSFHTKLLTQFASNAQCTISIIRLTDDKSEISVKNNREAYTRADWELNLSFSPGAAKQQWTLWPMKPGPNGFRSINHTGVLEGEGDPVQIARDVCTIITRSGAKILN